MTEAEWLECSVPEAMLDFLEGKFSDRKQGLFAVACYRTAPHLLNEAWMRNGVEVLERHADGQATKQDRSQAGRFAFEAYYEIQATGQDEASLVRRRSLAALNLYRLLVTTSGRYTARDASRETRLVIRPVAATPESRLQANLLRDLVGNPFRPLTLDPAWRTPAVLHLAQAIYDDRAFEQLPILADALEEAGCASREILDHCRGPGLHVRGCWAVDLVRSVD
jgi:hypothetical protein